VVAVTLIFRPPEKSTEDLQSTEALLDTELMQAAVENGFFDLLIIV